VHNYIKQQATKHTQEDKTLDCSVETVLCWSISVSIGSSAADSSTRLTGL